MPGSTGASPIHGRVALSSSDWDRAPQPVTDLRFDIQPSPYRRTQTFTVYRPADLRKLMDALAQASPQSWLEVRSHRGALLRLEPGSRVPFAEVLSFLGG
ncbi:hypothetical protein MUU72_05570 [Streptomyces sp. RS10V-4]|uniref:hypothetical protein n=1 Tax=Streptomyces rhizoryzae TaxID=2932493 RepID=UPI0020035514|nr:hypothetical protein [Streptomyces rhizoryzae]MCK7622579.1 hypothetical protein [Streptomyces rhizoryzae]